MKTLCFALILNAVDTDRASPPPHVQDLLKKRILFQLKQEKPDLQFYFDEPTCNVVGTYDYTGEAVQLTSNDKSIDLQLPYNDVIEGKKLDLSQISTAIENKSNVIAAASSQNLFEGGTQGFNSSDLSSGKSTMRKVLPWVVGVVALSLGGWAVYNSMNKGDDGGGATEPVRRRR